MTPLLTPTFTSHLNLRLLETPPPDTTSGYATGFHGECFGAVSAPTLYAPYPGRPARIRRVQSWRRNRSKTRSMENGLNCSNTIRGVAVYHRKMKQTYRITTEKRDIGIVNRIHCKHVSRKRRMYTINTKSHIWFLDSTIGNEASRVHEESTQCNGTSRIVGLIGMIKAVYGFGITS